MEAPELVEVLRYALHSTKMACADVNQELQRFGHEYTGRVLDQQAQITYLQTSVNRLAQDREALQAELDTQRTDYNLVVGDMVRLGEERQQTLEEKQHALEERDAALLEKDLNSLMLDQYRDETTEKQRVVDAKTVEIEGLAARLANAEAEVCSLRTLWHQCQMSGGESLIGTGERASSTKRKRRTRRRARRGKVGPPCCAMHH
ncbi:hypothetical protein PG985_006715 [Apiospora marii]